MDLTGKALWQIGAGDTERSYGSICIDFDVMIAGPGSAGRFNEQLYAGYGDIKNSLRRFCIEAKDGDIVLLRIGTGKVIAVGEIVGNQFDWVEAFSDVDGWDLQHVRRVRWYPNTSNTFPPKTLGGQVRTFASVNVGIVKKWVQSLDIDDSSKTRNISALPQSGKEIDPIELGNRLFIEGLPSEYVDKLIDTFASLHRVAKWYKNETKRPKNRPSEQETVCYLVMPLLLSLGWSQQTAAIEWHYVDVALFSGMPPENKNLACVVEAKLLGRSVFSPFGQAKDYALKEGRSSCQKLIVTDGIRYALHRRVKGIAHDGFELEAYLNILEMRDEYPIFNCKGAVQAVLGMAK